MISGLWHGANWTYVIWGIIHGFYIVASIWITKFVTLLKLDRLKLHYSNWLAVPITFILICIAWIFFRASHFDEALFILTKIARTPWQWLNQPHSLEALQTQLHRLRLTPLNILFVLYGALALYLVQAIQKKYGSALSYINRQNQFIRWSVYYLLVFSIVSLGMFAQAQFIYFQF